MSSNEPTTSRIPDSEALAIHPQYPLYNWSDQQVYAWDAYQQQGSYHYQHLYNPNVYHDPRVQDDQKKIVKEIEAPPMKKKEPNQFNRLPEVEAEAIRSLPLRDEKSMIFTDNLSKRIKLELQTRKIVQREFGEKVLGMKGNYFSKFINAVKLYDRCTEIGKRYYEKTLKWLELCEEDKKAVLEGRKIENFEPLISDKARGDKRKVQEDSEDVESKKMKLAVVPVISYQPSYQQPYQQEWKPMFNPFIYNPYYH